MPLKARTSRRRRRSRRTRKARNRRRERDRVDPVPPQVAQAVVCGDKPRRELGDEDPGEDELDHLEFWS